MKIKEAPRLAARDKHGRMTFRDGLSELWKNKMLYLMTLPVIVVMVFGCFFRKEAPRLRSHLCRHFARGKSAHR